jgi:hypothetical protein
VGRRTPLNAGPLCRNATPFVMLGCKTQPESRATLATLFRSLMNYREDDHVMAHFLLTVLVVRREVGTFLPWASAAAGGCE